jgi:hypothetical protein
LLAFLDCQKPDNPLSWDFRYALQFAGTVMLNPLIERIDNGSGWAAIAVAEFGEGAKSAIPDLLARCPTVTMVVRDVFYAERDRFGRPYGSPRRLTPDLGAFLQQRFGQYAEISSGATLQERYEFSSNGIPSATLEMRSEYPAEVHAWAYALSKITGQDFGTDIAAWRSWFDTHE